MDKEQLYQDILLTWGLDSQMNMMTEEIGELLQAMSKFKRSQDKDEETRAKAYTHLCEEIADVENMVNQFRYTFNSELIDKFREEKLERTAKKVEKAKKQKTVNG